MANKAAAAIIHDENLFGQALFSRFGTHAHSYAIIHFVFSSDQLVVIVVVGGVAAAVIIVAVNLLGVTATFSSRQILILMLLLLLLLMLFLTLLFHSFFDIWMEINMDTKSLAIYIYID